MTLAQSVDQFVEDKVDYYDQWVLDTPIMVSAAYYDELASIQKILFKLIKEFVENYENYKSLMPLSEAVQNVIKVFSDKPYRVGTYRTDFVFCENQVKLIEITCRFALNGIFLSAVMDKKARDFAQRRLPELNYADHYSPIFELLEDYLKTADSITVLTGEDRRNESKLYQHIFERAGYPVRFVDYNDIGRHLDQMQRSWVISELAFHEVLSLPTDILSALARMNISNDFRTVFLVHDKRMFEVLGSRSIQEKVLSAAEIELFHRFYIPTYAYREDSPEWEEARVDKDKWIIKHRSLGKSQKVFAGVVTSSEKWQRLFQSEDLDQMVLQAWIPQETITNSLKCEPIHDYITGTLLFFDDNFYGFGDFRTSSFPVTNKTDHRKAAGMVVDNVSALPEALRTQVYQFAGR